MIGGRLQSRKPLQFALILLLLGILLVLSNMVSMSTMNLYVPFFQDSWDPATTTVKQEAREDPAGSRLKIAVLSSFVASTMWEETPESSKTNLKTYTDHILNRECYCHLWNYSCIFNQTMELGLYVKTPDNRANNNANVIAAAPSNTTSDPWWLEFGAWERVAHLQAALPKYDWVLYGDIDYIIKDMSRPIESFIREFDLYGRNNLNVLVPVDDNEKDLKTFSAFAILIKNSPFGRKLLENWRAYGMGLCPNGNFPDLSKKKKYNWEHGDQTGLWYALMKTHMDFNPNAVKPPGIVTCNETTGLIRENYWLDINKYFRGNGYRNGNYGKDLAKVPDNQQIAWSRAHKGDSMSGLGVDGNWFPGAEKFWQNAFALHYKKTSEQWDPEMQIELGMCKRVHGCSVSWNKTTGVQAGCGRNSSSAY